MPKLLTAELGLKHKTEYPASVLIRLNDLIAQYVAHLDNVSGTPAIHGSADITNVIPGAMYPALTIADGLVLLTFYQLQYAAHIIDQTGAPAIHGAADATNVFAFTSGALSVETFAYYVNDAVTQYEAHRAWVTDSVHGSVDGTDAVTAPEIDDRPDAFNDSSEGYSNGSLWACFGSAAAASQGLYCCAEAPIGKAQWGKLT